MEPIQPKPSWATVAKDMASVEMAQHPDAKELYWKRYIAQMEGLMKEKENANKVSETVPVDESSGTRTSEGNGSESGSSEGISSEDIT